MIININKKANLKIYIPINAERARRVMLRIIVALSALAVICGIVCLALYLQVTHVTVEVGGTLTAAEIAKNDDAVFGDDFSADCLNHAGVYRFTVTSGEKLLDVRLKVVDTKAPDVTVKDVYFAIGGPLPAAEDFIESVYEPDGFSGELLDDFPEMKSPGSYPMRVRYTDASGNKTKVFNVNMILIYDSVAPTVEVADDIFVYIGESVAYRSVISVSDNCIGEITLDVDDSLVNTDEEGDYEVTLTAIDAVGNKSAAHKLTVHVLIEEDVEEKLFDKVDSAIEQIVKEGMSREEICRAVYDYVRKRISYSPMTYRSDILLAAYNSLYVTGEGDCYSYFAAAKVFFDRLGIENLEVQRLSGYTDDTHYWNLVNIGDESAPLWYHFDCTEMRAEYDFGGCLLTDVQIDAFNKLRDGFYRYDKSKYPPVAEEIITPIPALEQYYGQ